MARYPFCTMARHLPLILLPFVLSCASPARAATTADAEELYRAKRYVEAQTALNR